jgi:hypothetical protein
MLAIGMLCAALAWYNSEKAMRWFFVAACLLNLFGATVAALEGDFWKWLPDDQQTSAVYRKD